MDYALWEVTQNGATLPKTQVVEGVTTVMPITSVEDKAQRRLDVKDAKQFLEAIEKRFGGNASTKKTQRNLLKQQYENFKASSLEMLDQTFDRLQKLVNDMEEIYLRWQMAMLTMRARRFLKRTRRKLTVNGNETISFDKSNVKCYNCHKRGHFTKECRALRQQAQGKHKKECAYEGPNYALMAFTSLNSDLKGNPQIDLHDKGVIDSGCSKYMTGNMSYLTDYKEIDGGYVAFRGNPRGGKIIGKCTIKTATKDETSGILKSFITRIKNLVDHKVKVIRCDNRTEYKNREMNQFCEMKGILRQFSIARTPQQNGVAERRNRTIIEAARTMLADLKLLTTFWAEAVNTIYYVQNRVLVVKPHNKTIYELFHGRTPTLSFMRLFGCLVTILNTIDHLGEFNGKADEGFFVGYSLNSKAFKVFNNRIRIVEENLHIRFSENTPNIVGTKASDNVGQAKIETEPIKDYILLPLWTADLPFSKDPKSLMMMDLNLQVMMEEDNELLFDPNMPALEYVSIFNFSNNDEDNDIVADMNNMDTTIQVSPIPTTRIHKDYLLDQVIGDLHLATQTRQISNNLEEHGLLNPSWIEVMQEELLQFKLQEVWTLVDLPNRKRAICTKWVFRNKKDKRGIVIKNKARLVAQGHTQEEGIDSDEVFAPVVIIEAIRLFLAYALFKNFVVYQMDVKSVFLYEKIKEEVYVCQSPRFEDLDFSDRVYKVEKALYGLHQAPRAWYETLPTYLLDNGFQRGKIVKILYIKRHKGDILLVQIYVDDICNTPKMGRSGI
nr:hypothetical protein [Tanacetum cinerariifolium]